MSALQRKKPKPLAATEVLRRIRKMTAPIAKQVSIGIEVRCSLETANELIISLRGKQFTGAQCVATIQSSQAMFLALTLAKIFELPRRGKKGDTHSRRYNESDVASIPHLIRLLKQRRARAVLARRARRWTTGLSASANKNARDCEAAIDQAIAAYGNFGRRRDVVSAYLRLRTFRNKVLVHLPLDRARRVMPTYKDMFLLTDVARHVMGHALLAIKGHNAFFEDFENERRRTSKAFWTPALRAAMSDHHGKRTVHVSGTASGSKSPNKI